MKVEGHVQGLRVGTIGKEVCGVWEGGWGGGRKYVLETGMVWEGGQGNRNLTNKYEAKCLTGVGGLWGETGEKEAEG